MIGVGKQDTLSSIYSNSLFRRSLSKVCEKRSELKRMSTDRAIKVNIPTCSNVDWAKSKKNTNARSFRQPVVANAMVADHVYPLCLSKRRL